MAWPYHNKPPMGWPLDLSEPINDGLIYYGLFNDNTGNSIRDLSGNNQLAELQADAYRGAAKFGSGLILDGTGDYGVIPYDVNKPVFQIDGTKPFSGVMWIYPTVTLSDFEGFIGRNFISQWLFSAHGGDNSLALYADYSGSGGSVESANNVYSINKWSQIGFSFDGDSAFLVANGVVVAEGALAGATMSGTNNCAIGYNIGGVRYFTGIIDHAILWNRALSISEFALLDQFPFYGFMNPDEIPVLDQYYTIVAGAAGIMTTNTGYWGPTF